MKMNNKTAYKARVLFRKEIAKGVFVLRFTRDFPFKAGQMLWVRYPDDGPARLYSIASGEEEPFFEILFDVVENGALTPVLSKVLPGESVWISEPIGKFTNNGKPAVWIAIGTGIAPFVSMARTGLFHHSLLIQGGRNRNSFYYHEVFEKLPFFRYVKCISRETGEGYFQGRVTDFIENSYQPLPERQHLLCGSAEMVVEVRDLLIGKGVPFHNIISEIYF
jgi:ferredoxin--NADP+ reductase